MKYLLFVTILYWDGVHEVNKHDIFAPNTIVDCDRIGDEWAKWYLKKIPDVMVVRYECVKDEK